MSKFNSNPTTFRRGQVGQVLNWLTEAQKIKNGAMSLTKVKLDFI